MSSAKRIHLILGTVVLLAFFSTRAPSQSPIPTPGLRLWLRADAGVTQDQNGNISVWHDQSGLGNDGSQNSLENQPLLVENSVAGLPTAHFSGNQWLNLPDLMNGATAGEIFLVLKTQEDTPSQSSGLMFLGNGYESYYPFYADGQIYENFGSTVRYSVGNPSQPLDAYHIFDVSSQSGEWVAQINGILQYRTLINTVYFPSNPLLGHNSLYAAFLGDIAEVLIYDRVLSSTERQTVEYYLGGKYPVIASPPLTPGNMRAAAVAPTQISLTWDYALGNAAAQFQVERKLGTGAYAVIATILQATSYLDLNVSAGTSYTYRVRAVNYSGASSYSSGSSVTTPVNGPSFPTSGIRLWLKADTGASSPLTVWNDQSGNANDATQFEVASRPSVTLNSFTGRPAVHFSGNQWLDLPNLMNGVTAGEIFLVLKGEFSPSQAYGLMAFGDGYESYYPYADSQIYESFGSTIRYTIGFPWRPLDECHIYNISSQSGEWIARINSVVGFQTSTNTPYFPSAPLLGRNSYNSTFSGDIAEVLIYDRVLNASERDGVEVYLGGKYLLLDRDTDNDGLNDWREQILGSDPFNPDTNGDLVLDGTEYFAGFDPVSNDVDGDGLTNNYEYSIGTNPFAADSDGDGVADNQDAFPLDPSRWQAPAGDPNDHTPPTITLTEPVGATLLP